MKILKNYLIVDGDSITGKFIDYVFDELANLSIDRLDNVFIAAKSMEVIEIYRERIASDFPGAEFHYRKASSIKDHADIQCAISVGMLIASANKKTHDHRFIIISHDKLVLSIGSEVLRQDMTLCIPPEPKASNIDYEHPCVTVLRSDMFGKKTNENKPSKECPIPDWYLSEIPEFGNTGLRCKKVGTEIICNAPHFIPFPLKQTVTLGSSGDISLAIWDVPKGLYSHNIEFEYHPYPLSKWTVRSLKGHRRGNREIKVNGVTINASMGKRVLCNGDNITAGTFAFIFQPNKRKDFVLFEDPKVLLEIIEKRFKEYATAISEEHIPTYLDNTLIVDGTKSWDNAYLRNYRSLVKYNWYRQEASKFRSLYGTKEAFDNTFYTLNTIRNTVFHPSKQPISDEQKVALVDIFFELDSILPSLSLV